MLDKRDPLSRSDLTLSFANNPDPDLVQNADLKQLCLAEADTRMGKMTNDLSGRRKDLLGVHSGRSHQQTGTTLDKVQYLNITLEEYLEKPDVHILQWSPP